MSTVDAMADPQLLPITRVLNSNLAPLERLLLIAVAYYAAGGQRGQYEVVFTALAGHVGLSVRALRKHWTAVIEKGWLRFEPVESPTYDGWAWVTPPRPSAANQPRPRR